MRVMISQPMKGLTREEIERNRAEAVKRLEAEGHEVVDSIVTDEPPADSNAALHYLGQSLQIMATCDAVLFLEGWEKARGCRMEYEACKKYKLKIYYFRDAILCHVLETRAGIGDSKLLGNFLYELCVDNTYSVVIEAVKILCKKINSELNNKIV